MKTKSLITLLDRDSKAITQKLDAYRNDFKNIISDFKTEYKLDKSVIRTNNDKTERGELQIVGDNKLGYKDNIFIPYYFVFIPYKKTGELSDVKRTDKFDVTTPGEYFEKILEIYSPEE